MNTKKPKWLLLLKLLRISILQKLFWWRQTYQEMNWIFNCFRCKFNCDIDCDFLSSFSIADLKSICAFNLQFCWQKMQDIILPFYEGFNKFILFPIEPHVSIQKSSKISNLNIPVSKYSNFDSNVVIIRIPNELFTI